MTMPRRDSLILTAAAITTALPSHAAESDVRKTVTPAQFNAWLALRGGEDGPAYWYSEGLVRAMYDGRVDSRMIGLETWITPKALRTSTSAVSISRKVYFFLEQTADKIVIDAATGKPRRPSIYSYQVRTFTLKDGAIDYTVETHDTVSSRMGGPGTVYTINQNGDQLHVNYAIFRTVTEPDGAKTARGEIYDYFDNGPAIKDPSLRFQGTWSSASTTGQMANLMHRRYPTFESIPNDWLKTHIRQNGPMWMAPPKDMVEIEALRQTSPVKTNLIPA